MNLGLQAGFGDAIAPLNELTALQIQWARCDVTDATNYTQIVNTFLASAVLPLFLIRDPAKAQPLMDAALPTPLRFALEVYNEPNINDISVDTYVNGVNQVFADARARGFIGPVYAGAIANFNPEGIDYLRAAEPRLSTGIDIAVHRYQPGTQVNLHGQSRRHVPWEPFESREDELHTIRTIIGARRLAVTEFGYHTAEEKIGFISVRLTNEQARDNIVEDFKLYRANGVGLAVVYQWQDGPNEPGTDEPPDNYLSRFGIVKADGTRKPQADAFRLFRAEDSMTWEPVKVVTSHAGTILQNPDGTTRSLNPASPTGGPYHWETRPTGTFGPFELCTPGGGTVAYNPLAFYGGVGEPVVFGFKDKVPNTDGYAAITLEPLTI